MLTAPVTILNWSFVRDGRPCSVTRHQIALAMRDAVMGFEQASAAIIQVDEAALHEGLPLRRREWQAYLSWAIECFRIAAFPVADATQIHTHMCCSAFNDIIAAIGAMDADVISIETARSQMERLDAFAGYRHPAEIGPGEYDIHSPRVPAVDEMAGLLRLPKRLPASSGLIPIAGTRPAAGPEVRHDREHGPQADALGHRSLAIGSRRGHAGAETLRKRKLVMKFGVIIRGQYPLGDDMQVRLREDLEAAKFAEQLGYDLVAKGSHYSSHPFQYIQQIPYLAQVAAVAPKLRLVPGVVLLPLHSPLHVAEELASLDVMSGGKLVFGAGIGYREVEFRAFGTTLKQAGRRFEECLTAVKRLWSEDFVTMEASYFSLERANCTVLPVQKPMPPIWIGANIDVGIRRAARMADAWFVNPHNKLATIARQMEVYKRELDACGKPFPSEFPMAREVFIAPTRAEAIARARPSLEAKYKAYREWGQDKVMPSSDHFDLGFDDLVDDRFLIGSPAEVTEQILDLNRRFGVTTLIAGVHWVGMPKELALEQMQLMAEEVFPAIRQAL